MNHQDMYDLDREGNCGGCSCKDNRVSFCCGRCKACGIIQTVRGKDFTGVGNTAHGEPLPGYIHHEVSWHCKQCLSSSYHCPVKADFHFKALSAKITCSG